MPTVLVVDDTAIDRRLAGGLLEKSGDIEVLYAENGNEALICIEQTLPDLVLTDMQMPELDGLQLVTAVSQRHPNLPVVLMTAHGSENIAAQALANGAACFVPKSDLADSLVDTVLQILAMAHADERYHRLIESSTKTEFEFSLENDTNLIDPLVDLVQQIIGSMQLCDSSNRVRVGVALEHALLNAMLRGNLEVSRTENPAADRETASLRAEESPYQSRRVYVSVLITRERAQFIIRDEGNGFETSSILKAGDPEALKDGHGRGLVLMTTFMDEVVFNDAGNEVTMIKRRTGSAQ